MFTLIGTGLSIVAIIYIMAMITTNFKVRKIIPFLIVLSILGSYYFMIRSEFYFHLLSSILVIPQVLFSIIVIIFFLKSIFKRKKKPFENDTTNFDYPFFSILIATHNEENVIEKTVSYLSTLNYDKSLYDITVVDDSSTDRTIEVLKRSTSKIEIIDRSSLGFKKVANRNGKARAINDVIDGLKGDLVLVLDADSLPEKDVLLKVYKYFQDDNIGIVQCRNTFYNERNSFVSLLTSIDIYSVQHAMYIPMSSLGVSMFEGRAGVIRKSLFKELNGFDESLPGEDYDFTYRTAAAGYKVIFDEDIISSEQVTETPKEWLNQRKRWLANHVLSFLKNIRHLHKSKKLNKSRKFSLSFVMFNLLFFFLLNFHGPIVLIDQFLYQSHYSLLFTVTFVLIITLFVLPYLYHSKRFYLVVFLPLMILYFWVFSIIETWVLINEKIMNIKLYYKKASHRKPLVNEI